ncbi:hypothetical protein C2G38_2073341 [Gigaspora rosea]|uniref:HMG box domain-containing protein n=1 Tax=Gigaspora rosea TaxID=44941 RepID=A0A397VW75_9GLOM|nr:hypothetical protein C2G38_2073341 [Gigaspora rosea]
MYKTLILELNLEESAIWNPQFSLRQLIGQRKKPNKSPPRPPNAFFLFKNNLMLAARQSGHRLTMTHLCRVASKIWENSPKELKSIYGNLALEAHSLHIKDFPGYTYKPGKKELFKAYEPVSKQRRQRAVRAVNLISQTDESNSSRFTDQKTAQMLEDAQHPHDTQIHPYYESTESTFYVDSGFFVDSEIMNMYLRLEDEAQLKSML